jgi:polysaccharide pyruvyl transferase WcaK-like protein
MIHTRPAKQVTLITRLLTNNAGNQALSSALIGYFTAHYPDHRITALERSPSALNGYVLSAIPLAEVVPRFRSFACDLLNRCSATPLREPTAGDVPAPILQATMPFHKRIIRRSRRHLPALDSLMATSEYRRRVTTYQRSAAVIANPAGEFDPAAAGDAPARLLLDLYVAKLAGAHTAAVNLSAEMSDEKLKALVRAVGPEFDAIVTRDQSSRAALVELGLPAERVSVAPDAVFSLPHQAERPGAEGRTRRVGLALNPTNIHVNEGVAHQLVRKLLDRGYAVTAISNCWSVDKNLWTPLTRRFPLEVQPSDLPYDSYLSYLATFDYLASGRMHTNVFGALAGVPSIPLEGNLFRTAGLLGGHGYPIPVVHLGARDWQTRFTAALVQVEEDAEAIRASLAGYVASRSLELERVYSSVFTPLLAH